MGWERTAEGRYKYLQIIRYDPTICLILYSTVSSLSTSKSRSTNEVDWSTACMMCTPADMVKVAKSLHGTVHGTARLERVFAQVLVRARTSSRAHEEFRTAARLHFSKFSHADLYGRCRVNDPRCCAAAERPA